MPDRPVRIVTGYNNSMPVRIVTSGGEPVREVSHGGDPVRIVTEGVSDPVRGISAAPSPPPSSDCLVVASATCLLCLQSDALVLNDGDPVSVWADASGQGNHFTQTGDARPTYHTDGGAPFVSFNDAEGDYMSGPDFADNLESFAVFSVFRTSVPSLYAILEKWDQVTADEPHWAAYNTNMTVIGQTQLNVLEIYDEITPIVENTWYISSILKLSSTTGHIYINGDNSNEGIVTNEPLGSFSNSTNVTLGLFAYLDLHAAMIYSPAPNDSDRAAIEAWLAEKYGITLP